MDHEQPMHEEAADRHVSEYGEYYDQGLVEEQPFYYKGMTLHEYEIERTYLNEHLDSFYEGSYLPLWKQTWYH